MIAQLLLAAALGISVQDHLDGTELGDANLTVAFETGGKGAELVARDLAGLAWLGAIQPKPSASKDCLHDVQLVVRDDAELPAKR